MLPMENTMTSRSSLLTKWILASLLTGLMLSAGPVAAKAPTWSKTNRTRYTNARTTQHKSQRQSQVYRLRSRKQYAYYKKNGNSKQLTWSRKNRVKSAVAKVRTIKAKARRAESLAVVAGKRGNKVRAANLRATAKKLNGRAVRLNTAIGKYVAHHGLNGQAAKIARSQPGVSSTAGSSTATKSTRTPRSAEWQQQRATKRAIGKGFNASRKSYNARMDAANQLMAEAYQTNNPSMLRSAVAQKALAARHQVKAWKSQASGLRAKAERNPTKAAEYNARADKLDSRANLRTRAIKRYVAKYKRAIPKAQQVMDGEAVPGVDPGAQQVQAQAMASRKGKKIAKIQMRNGNLSGALGTLQAMEAKASRKGLMGMVDGYRKWSTRRKLRKMAYKEGKGAARAADYERAQESLGVIEATHKDGRLHKWSTNSKFRGIANSAIKGAKHAAKNHRGVEAYQLLDFAKQVQAYTGRAKPTMRWRWTRRTAKKRIWKDVKRFSKEGNMEAFRTSMKLASAYAREDGKPGLTKRNLRKTRKLYMKTLKRSVVRALDDAQMLISGKMGYVSVEEGAKRLAYAEDTANALAHRGIAVRHGLFRRNVGGKMAKVRKSLVKAWGKQQNMHQVRPGLLKRLFNRWSKQPHRRPPPAIAPVDSRWERKMMRQQQSAQGGTEGMTPEMMAELQAQQAQQGGGGQGPSPTLVQQRQGVQ
jgi:hypothetical protein